MKVVCAWCKDVMRPGPADPVSHGICEECRNKILKERGTDGNKTCGESNRPGMDRQWKD